MFSSSTLAAGTVIAIAPNALVSAMDAVPRFEIAREALVHMEDTSPLQIASGAQGSGVLATPSRSLWQTDSIGLRMIMEVSWGLRASAGLAWLTATNW